MELESNVELTGQSRMIRIKNFGPIKKAEIELTPFTIFIGPNKAGKSYAATLINSLVNLFNYGLLTSFIVSPRAVDDEHVDSSHISNDLINWVLMFYETVYGTSVDKNAVRREIALLLDYLEENITNLLVRGFACDLDDLIRHGSETMQVEIESNNLKLDILFTSVPKASPRTRVSVAVTDVPSFDRDEIIKAKSSGDLDDILQLNEGLVNLLAKNYMLRDNQGPPSVDFIRMIVFIRNALAILFHSAFGDIAYYLPAARGGSLQTYRSLTRTIYGDLPLSFVKRSHPREPTLTGSLADLFANLVDMPDKMGPLAEIVGKFEDDILKGHIESVQDGYGATRLEFIEGAYHMGLHRVSSAISELAPLFLYLKYYVIPDSLLIIEEPESHLHPHNQMKIAFLLARLLSENVNVLITTHSEYILNAIDLCVMASSLPDDELEKLSLDTSVLIDRDELAIFLFEFDDDGFVITKPLAITEDGIPDEEFSKVHSVLYDKLLLIDAALARQRHDEE
ncbi:MAG: AAA family ATPase [Candidatus Thorarchaeota archaeon]|nr:AAA family ATPase [Candidatus Thorarchaeota archaeon]